MPIKKVIGGEGFVVVPSPIGGTGSIAATTNIIKGDGAGAGVDSGVAVADVSIDASGFAGNLATTDDTVQKVCDKLDALAVTGIAAVVDDTSPQLGGTLDFNGNGAVYTGAFRIKTDGSFQLYNSDTLKYHTLTLSGADGSVVLSFGAGEV